MAEPIADQTDVAAPRPISWGLGDAGLGFLLGVFGSIFASALYFMATDSVDDDPPLSVLLLLQVPLWAGLLGIPLWAARTKGNGARTDFGLWMRPLDAPVGLAIGVALQLLVIPAIYYPLFRLTPLTSEDVSAPAEALASDADGPLGVVLLVLLVVIGAPLAEEVFYRGLLLRSFARRGMGAASAVALTSVLFGLSHFLIIQLPALLAFGLVAATLAERTDRLGPSVWAHVGFNATTVTALLLTT
ncbi:MAG: lysostaphin resistance A-like protein [Acidimicrobiales bacterium]